MSALNEVKVFVRIRPTAQFAHELIEYSPEEQTVNVRLSKKSKTAVLNNQMSSWCFRLSGVLHNLSQDEVYQQVAHSVVLGALEGYNGTVMCFGQTGSGKTFTMTGASESYKQRGIIPRAIQDVFHEIDTRVDYSFSVRLSFLEIYNETLVDLLASVKGGQTKHCGTLSVVEEPEGAVSVKGLSLHPVHSKEEALNLLFEGEMNKIIGAHALNKNSSRSHCIFTIHIESRSHTRSNAAYVTSKLNLVDLAGSERLSKTGSEGQVQRETLYINRSLSFLEQAILALADRRREHVPFRQSKLTHALKDSLGGNCNTVLVANIFGEAAQIEETLSTLRFAARMKCVRTEPAVNKHIDPALQVQRLQKEIQILKQELFLHNTLADRAGVTYEDLSEAQVALVKSEVQRYLAGTLDELRIESVQQIQAVFAEFKKAFQEQEQRLKEQTSQRRVVVEHTQSTLSTSDAKEPVNEVVGLPASSHQQSVTLGRGKKVKESSRKKGHDGTGPGEHLTMMQSETEIVLPPSVDESKGSANDDVKMSNTPPSKMEAFEIYKSEGGSELNRILKENKSMLKERLTQVNNLTGNIKSIKWDIDHMKIELQLYNEQRQGKSVSADGEPVPDAAEVTLLMKLREAKDQYRQQYTELLSTKAEVQYCRYLVDQCRMRLFTDFESWYNESFVLPDEVLSIFKDGGPIRPGLVPLDNDLALRAPHSPASRRNSMGLDTYKPKPLATVTPIRR
ncbi:kinesin-like protein KIF9 isoform X2 [Tachysurus fulvidraco]|uniref:kinesin-like protein KIF9 isoform X2 n=1 Tax=Tachysurus fulvidraco TaxID=1234273 RepID=UPI001FF05B75|nr:kinesin-like protein KIF9 isoform X2 [Tachysurus fulvidraco]